MWIIPKNLPVSVSAQDMAVSKLDSKELSQLLEQSFMWKKIDIYYSMVYNTIMSNKITDGLTNQQRYYLRCKNDPEFKKSRNESQKRWRKKNPQKSRATCKAYYEKNKAKELERAKTKFKKFKTNGYSDKHRLNQRVNKHKRRVSKECSAPLTTIEWLQILENAGGCCESCGSSEDITIDHIIPVSKGGKHTAKNIQVLCRKCNSSKGAKCG